MGLPRAKIWNITPPQKKTNKKKKKKKEKIFLVAVER